MKTFLQLVTQGFYSKIGNDLSCIAIVFPSKRTSLFFNEHLANRSDQPLWPFAYVSISELFQQLSALKLRDSIRLVCKLYKVFHEETKSEESFDDFHFWGGLLISDFDGIDENMVNAGKLFTNPQDLKDIINDYNFLDEEQKQAIQQFFLNFSTGKRTPLKEKLISPWDRLGNIYRQYRRNLEEPGLAYEGMLYRNVIEHPEPKSSKYDRYVPVGFNVPNKVEIHPFQQLQSIGKTPSYWDYDVFYTQSPSQHK